MKEEKEISRDEAWLKLLEKLKNQFGKTPDLNAILFLIGVRELGKVKKKFTKEEKQDLMHIAICSVLSQDGYFELTGLDQDGWPHWAAMKKLPAMDLKEQEDFMKDYIVRYFHELNY
jgi:hypothetical protein